MRANGSALCSAQSVECPVCVCRPCRRHAAPVTCALHQGSITAGPHAALASTALPSVITKPSGRCTTTHHSAYPAQHALLSCRKQACLDDSSRNTAYACSCSHVKPCTSPATACAGKLALGIFCAGDRRVLQLPSAHNACRCIQQCADVLTSVQSILCCMIKHPVSLLSSSL
jgi:hypothetical protein